MAASILYINVIYGERFREMVLAGIRCYATACGWNVEALQWRDSRPNMVSALLAARRDIVGCVIEATDDVVRLPPRVFGRIPVVYLHAVPSLYSGRIARVVSDNNTAICEASKPTISSISIDHERSGYLAAKLIGELASANSVPPSSVLSESNPATKTIGPLLAVRRDSTRGSGRREPFILEAVEMVRREASSGLTAARLARRFPCSRSLFYLRFREAMGHSVLDEILNVRLERVCTLLATTYTPIEAIADFCGFNSGRSLRDHFLSRMKMSLREFRERNRR